MSQRLIVSHNAADAQTIQLGQHDVQDDKIGVFGSDFFQALLTVFCRDNLVTLILQFAGEILHKRCFILNDDHFRHVFSAPCSLQT
jgi:hypothetical protein